MNSRGVIVLVLCGLLALQLSNVEGLCFRYMCGRRCLCFRYMCRRRCVYSAPRYEEYAFRYLWPIACGQNAVNRGFKACCVTWGNY